MLPQVKQTSHCHLFFLLALLFGGDINPAHPKHIGSIDPNCNVAEVVKGKEAGFVFLLIKKFTIRIYINVLFRFIRLKVIFIDSIHLKQ